jgi:hypothetical protein
MTASGKSAVETARDGRSSAVGRGGLINKNASDSEFCVKPRSEAPDILHA